jgi:hypothetical protein
VVFVPHVGDVYICHAKAHLWSGIGCVAQVLTSHKVL